MAAPIEDYALIGDCETAALVGRDGSIDWLCWPRFDGGACFAALLGTPEHGRWQIAPVDPKARVTRRYRDDTLILETEFTTRDVAATLVDFMPPRGKASDVVRIVIGRRGQLTMSCELILRFDYGSLVPWVTRPMATLIALCPIPSTRLPRSATPRPSGTTGRPAATKPANGLRSCAAR